MKIGLYSITYLGCWYRGEALTLPELIQTAKQFGYDGVEFDGKRPHANPLDWPKHKCQELARVAEGVGVCGTHAGKVGSADNGADRRGSGWMRFRRCIATRIRVMR